MSPGRVLISQKTLLRTVVPRADNGEENIIAIMMSNRRKRLQATLTKGASVLLRIFPAPGVVEPSAFSLHLLLFLFFLLFYFIHIFLSGDRIVLTRLRRGVQNCSSAKLPVETKRTPKLKRTQRGFTHSFHRVYTRIQIADQPQI